MIQRESLRVLLCLFLKLCTETVDGFYDGSIVETLPTQLSVQERKEELSGKDELEISQLNKQRGN